MTVNDIPEVELYVILRVVLILGLLVCRDALVQLGHGEPVPVGGVLHQGRQDGVLRLLLRVKAVAELAELEGPGKRG